MTITEPSPVGTPVDNGINLQALLDAREALGASPDLARFQWRASCTWRNGTHSYSIVEGFRPPKVNSWIR